MIASLLTALGAVGAGGLLAHRVLRERKPWLALGLAPQLGACLLGAMALLSLHPGWLVLGLLAAVLVLWCWPGPGWEPPRGQLTACGLALLGLSVVFSVGRLDGEGLGGLEMARYLRGWQGWPGPGLDLLAAALSRPSDDPLSAAWSLRLALHTGGALVIAGLVGEQLPPLAGLVAGLLVPLGAPLGAPLWLYVTVRIWQGSLPLLGAPVLGLVPLWSPEVMPIWWGAGLVGSLCWVRTRAGWTALAAAYGPALLGGPGALNPGPSWSLALVPLGLLVGKRPLGVLHGLAVMGTGQALLGGGGWPLLSLAGGLLAARRPALGGLLAVAVLVWLGPPAWQTPAQWRMASQGLDRQDLQAMAWIGSQALPGERVLAQRPELARPLEQLTGLECVAAGEVWLAFQGSGRGDLLRGAGIDWIWMDPGQGPPRSPWLGPGPRWEANQIFSVREAGSGFESDYRFPCRIQLPPGPLRPRLYDPLALDVTNHDRVARRLGWVRAQVEGQVALDILAGRGRLAPELGDRVTHALVTPARPGPHRLRISLPWTVEGRPWVLTEATFEVTP